MDERPQHPLVHRRSPAQKKAGRSLPFPFPNTLTWSRNPAPPSPSAKP
jgi:hypothetical protein